MRQIEGKQLLYDLRTKMERFKDYFLNINTPKREILFRRISRQCKHTIPAKVYLTHLNRVAFDTNASNK